MTISTTLLFSRAVNLMGQQQSDLAALKKRWRQERNLSGRQTRRIWQ